MQVLGWVYFVLLYWHFLCILRKNVFKLTRSFLCLVSGVLLKRKTFSTGVNPDPKYTIKDIWNLVRVGSQVTWLWLSKRQSSPTTVHFRTTPTRTITPYELLVLLGANHLLWSLVKSLTGKPFDPRRTPTTENINQNLVDQSWEKLGLKDLLFAIFILLFLHAFVKLILSSLAELLKGFSG